MDDFNDIAVFVAVVDAQSFTQAAARLKQSRPVVSKYVSRLEASLGVQLLNRTTRRLSLTEAGRIFYERCKRGLDDINEARAEISRLQEHPSGVLHINVPMSFGILHVAPRLPAFMQKYPDINVEMDLSDYKLDVIDEGFDVSIRISELPDSSLIARRLAPCHHMIVASPDYLKRAGTPRQPDELTSHEIATYSLQQSTHRWSFNTITNHESVQVPVTSRLQFSNSLALREAVIAGGGIARMPSFIVGEDVKQGRLVALLPDYKTLEVSIYAVYPQRRHLSPKVRAFIDYLAEAFTDTPYWDQVD